MQRTFELVVLLIAHVVELLGDVAARLPRKSAGSQQLGLLDRPTIEIAIVTCRLRARATCSSASEVRSVIRTSCFAMRYSSVAQYIPADDQTHHLVRAFQNLMDTKIAQHPLDGMVT